ncbi:MAG TPA: O-antigen ligase family protein [Candidatus Paceibacterota bacterium]|nr:O-antigen ligase family protein [Candidatus Paceibacterota bacterium]
MTVSEKILRWVVLIGVFALPFVPLIVSTWLFFPYITGKNFAFRVIVEIITFCWLALALLNPNYRPRRNWIFIAFLAFIAIIAIADAQGANPFKSFWSNFERMDGWITIAHLFCYTVVAACVINAEKLWQRLFELSLAISVFIDLWGFSQILGVVALGEGGTSGLTARIDATFGNPIYLAVYMLFHVFLAALLIYQIGKERWSITDRIVFPVGLVIGLLYIAAQAGTSGGSLPLLAVLLYFVILACIVGLMFARRTYLYSFVIAFDTIALLFTGTRGTILGLIGGVVLAALIYAVLAPDARRARPYVLGGIAALIVLSGGLWLARDTAFVQKVGFLQRLASISLTDTTIASRFTNMSIAWKGIEERPILGWGQEDYAIVFDKYYDPRMYADEPWFDRVHNIVFDWWVAGGTLGLLAYLSVLFAYLWVLWRSRAFTIIERSILTGLLAGYFVHNLTVFDNITSYILFGTVLAYIVYRASATDDFPYIPLPRLGASAAPVVALAAGVLSLGAIWFVNGKAYEQNRAILSGLAAQSQGLTQNLADFKQAVSYDVYGEQEAREQLAQVTTELAGADPSQVSNDLKSQFLNFAVQQIQLQAQASPLDARFPLFLGTMLDAYGQVSVAQPALEKAHELSPNKQTILFELGLNAEARSDTAGALNYFKQAYDLETDYLDARLYYAAAAIDAGDGSLADQLLAPVIPTGQAADARIASAYASRGQYGKIVTVWQAAVAANPSNAQNYFTLAAAYYAAGNPTQAIATLQAAETAVPSSAAQAEAVIQEIKNGTIKVQ